MSFAKGFMRNFKALVLYSLLIVFASALVSAQDPNIVTPLPNTTAIPAPVASPAPATLSSNDIIDKVVEREHYFMAQMRHLHPLVETYIQNLKPADGKVVPTSDQYFLGRIDMSNGAEDRVFKSQSGFGRRFVSKLTSIYGMKFLPLGFAQMVVVDEDFQRKDYDFSFVRREFLGEVRCIVIDVQPKGKDGRVRFVGRIWVEDQDYNIVRFNGTYGPDQRNSNYLHFDSWRLNMRPGTWLPAYIYSEESDKVSRAGQKFHFKAQTRLWGYDLQALAHNSEFTEIAVDSPDSVHDQSEAAQDASPVESERRWQREAEDNSVERLQKIGLIAPEGDVDKVLLTVINNLIVTNNLNIDPPVRARVLLTSPLESFTIGHTIIISRGLLDVLPDEASLAMVLAHELGHVVLGHRLDTKFAFNDRMFFPDEDTFERLDFARVPADEEAADKKAVELLTNSPYKDKLASAGLFLKALQQEAPELKSLIRPHMGNGLASGNSLRMSALLSSAPNVDGKATNQIAALPLGGRVKLDPWSNRVELLKSKPVTFTSADEKMPFEVTPFFPFLTRFPNPGAEKVALTTPDK
jgi:Peptidase family M48